MENDPSNKLAIVLRKTIMYSRFARASSAAAALRSLARLLNLRGYCCYGTRVLS